MAWTTLDSAQLRVNIFHLLNTFAHLFFGHYMTIVIVLSGLLLTNYDHQGFRQHFESLLTTEKYCSTVIFEHGTIFGLIIVGLSSLVVTKHADQNKKT
jgi:hypothetical protein